MNRNISLVLFGIVGILMFYGCGATPIVTVGTTPNLPAMAQPNDALLQRTLLHVLSDSGVLDYSALRADTDLTEYLKELAVCHIDAFVSREAETAFWINAHNAFVLDLLRRNRPARLRIDVSKYRGVHVYLINGVGYSLSQIEDDIVGGKFHDPRLFFALYYGGKSSPALSRDVYSPLSISAELDSATKHFLMNPALNRVDRKTHLLLLSQIISDHSGEIEDISGSVQAFVRAYSTDGMAEYLGQHSKIEIDYLPYNWEQ